MFVLNFPRHLSMPDHITVVNDTSITLTLAERIIEVSLVATDRTITLPPVAASAGNLINVVAVTATANTVTVQADSSDLEPLPILNGSVAATSYTLTDGCAASFFSTGRHWVAIEHTVNAAVS